MKKLSRKEKKVLSKIIIGVCIATILYSYLGYKIAIDRTDYTELKAVIISVLLASSYGGWILFRVLRIDKKDRDKECMKRLYIQLNREFPIHVIGIIIVAILCKIIFF